MEAFLVKLSSLFMHKRVVLIALGGTVFMLGLIFGVLHFRKGTPQNNDVLSAQSTNSFKKNSAFSKGQPQQPGDDNSPPGADKSISTPDKSTQTSVAPSTVSGSSAAPAPTVAQSMPTSTVVKITDNGDSTTTKEIIDTTPIPFELKTQSEVNLKRGQAVPFQTGQNGVRTIVYNVVYEKSGKEISRATKSDSITTQPIDQITKVGISDFNLNIDTFDGTEFGLTCFNDEYDLFQKGCEDVPSVAYFSALTITGKNYVSCISSISGICRNESFNLLSIIPFSSGNIFDYGGREYRADPRAGGGEAQLLTASVCAQYGLACGTW